MTQSNRVTRLAALFFAGLLALFGGLRNTANAEQYLDLEQWLASGLAVQPGVVKPWRLIMGIGGGIGPEFLSANRYEAKPLPLFDASYRDTFFISSQRGVGWNFVNRRTFRFGPRLTLDFGRRPEDSEGLTGTPSVDTGLEAGLFAEIFNGPWRLKGDVRKELIEGHDGILASLDLAYGGRWSDHVSVFVGGNFHWMDSRYADSYFSIPSAFVGNGRSRFEAESGIRDTTGYVHIVYDLPNSVFVALDLKASLLFQSAADSPIAETDVQYFGGAILGVRF